MTPARGLAHLLWPRWRAGLNASRARDGRSLLRLVFFGALGLGFMVGGFVGARWLFALFLEVEFLTELLIRRVLGIVLLFFTGLLVFSSVITAFTTYYLATDLPTLVSAPVSPAQLYLARFVDTWVQSSWMMLVFALPIVAGCGPVLGAPWFFYAALPLLLLPLTVLCAAAGTWITLALARWLPARRTHDVLLVLAMLGFLVVYVAFRLAEPERFLQPDGFGDLVALIGSLREAGAPTTPSAWTLEALFAVLRGDWGAAALPAAVLVSAAGGAVALGAWLARAVYLPSYWLAQEGRADAAPLVQRLLGRFAHRRPPRVPATPIAAFVVRDTRTFFRTTGQWTQLLLVAALVVVYVFNFRHFRTLADTGVVSVTVLFFVNAALGGLVVTTVAVRFLYPAVSLEGRAFWAVRVAPVDPRTLLRAKVRWGLWPLLALSLLITVSSNLIVAVPAPLVAASAVLAVLTTYGLTGLGVGMGASDPRFHEDNPAKIASGAGGVSFMLAGLAYLTTIMVLCGWPLFVLRAWAVGGRAPPAGRQVTAALLIGAAVLVTVLIHHLPLWWGARSLRRRED